MSAARRSFARSLVSLALASVVACSHPARAVAQPAPAPATSPDSTLRGYLDSLADSTDARFGAVAAPIDTTGLDSARVYAFSHPDRWRYKARHGLSVFPVLDFNRVDGPSLGAGAQYGAPEELGRLSGQWAEATGPNFALGSGGYLKRFERTNSRWEVQLFGGRTTAVMDRELQGHELSALAAFVSGGDRSEFLRRDGVRTRLSREGATLRLAAGYRDELESPRVTTATWNLRHRRPVVVDNLPAAFGRAHELNYEVLWRVPRTPLTAQVLHATSSRKLGSDFEYRRTLAGAGGDIGIGRAFAVVPQLEYGALTGEALPQEAFYLGGSQTLRSLPYGTAGGSRLALARLDLILVRDIFDVLHLPHPSVLPLQVAAFAASGAAWGRDPYTGRVRPGLDWPNAGEWRSEAGVSVMWQPGIPDPAMFTRINWALPLGPGPHDSRFSVSVGRGLDLLRHFERE